MTRLAIRVAVLFIAVMLFLVDFSPIVRGQPPTTGVGAALSTIFSPSRAPPRKTMGLLQRTFLDLSDQRESPLEIAIVVDGTDSMETELTGVRASIGTMLDDLRRSREEEVKVAIVVYRDSASPSGPVKVLLPSFVSDVAGIQGAVSQIQPEDGSPFFHELPDLGIHAALTKLNWSEDPRVLKWIFLFGDAPPYQESYADPQYPDARRMYATDLLASLAARKGIRINCVLCPSDEKVDAAYQAAVAETRDFMSDLAGATDGLMLDLSYPEIRSAVVAAAKRPVTKHAPLKAIAMSDLESFRRSAQRVHSDEMSIAVLPHTTMRLANFRPDDEANLVATAIRHRFAQIPGLRIISPIDIQKQLRRLKADNVSEEQTLRALAARLGVQYVIWGSIDQQTTAVQSAMYRRSDGNQVVRVSFTGKREDLATAILQAAVENKVDFVERLDANWQRILEFPLAEIPATTRELLTAVESLEQTLEHLLGNEASDALLQIADSATRSAMKAEPRNALGFWLHANVAMNQAMALYQNGQSPEAMQRMGEMKGALRRAYQGRDRIPNSAIRLEIEADFAHLVERNTQAALEKYTKMTEPSQPNGTRLRGHWMLLGIYCGDWGSDVKFIDSSASRQQTIHILAEWPESPQARLLKEWLRWSDESESTQFHYLPIFNDQLAAAKEI